MFDTVRDLTVLDRLFHAVLDEVCRLSGLTTHEAYTPAERAEAAALADAPEIPAALMQLHRRYEAQARVLVVRCRGAVVGTMTVYVPTTFSRTVESGPLLLPQGVAVSQTVDIGGLYVHPDHRGGARLVFLRLLAAAQQLSASLRRSYWVGMTHPKLIGVFRRINPTTTRLSMGEDVRPDALRAYWACYRAGKGTAPVPFVLDWRGGAPSRVLTTHLIQQVQGRLCAGLTSARR